MPCARSQLPSPGNCPRDGVRLSFSFLHPKTVTLAGSILRNAELDTLNKLLPGQRLSSSGRPRLDYVAVSALAFPFMLNSAVQAVLNATDTWFVGRLSPAATSAMGAVYWPVLVFILLFGGVGLSVQTLVAQAYGGRPLCARVAGYLDCSLGFVCSRLPVFAVLADDRSLVILAIRHCGRAL